MLERILIPVDGSDFSDRILSQVRRILLVEDAEVLLVRVLPDGQAGSEAADAARHHLETLRATFTVHGARATMRVVRGEPAARILEIAREFKPSLIALSTHGRAGLARWIHGSVAEQILRGSSVPLLVATAAALENAGQDFAFRRILVPLDGSRAAASILPLVHDLARIHASDVLLFHALQLPSSLMLAEPIAVHAAADTNDGLEGEAKRMLSRHGSTLGGVRVRSIVSWGSPAACIVDTAETEQADLLAMTTHGRTGAARLLFGSIAESVLRHARCPLVLRRALAAGSASPKSMEPRSSARRESCPPES